VLLAIQDELLRDTLAMAYRSAGYALAVASHEAAVARFLRGEEAHLTVVDAAGPGGLDLSIIKRIRSVSDAGLLALIPSSEQEDFLDALRLGADQALAQSFSLAELLTRSEVVLRRCAPQPIDRIELGDLMIDEGQHTVTRRGEALELTALEFSLLTTLCRNPRKVLAKTQLLSVVWGFEHFDPNIVEVHISALRRKMEAFGPRVIHTVRGVGYVLRPVAAEDLVDA
jgi:DNA-binding response OmpR family regulator